MIGNLLSDTGRRLDAEASLVRQGTRFELTFESSGESGRRNRDYMRAFGLAIKRLAGLGATLTDGRVESRRTRDMKPADKRLVVDHRPYPIQLATVTDLSGFAKRLRSSGARVGNSAGRGGNTIRRIALEFTLPRKLGSGVEAVRRRLFGGTVSDREEHAMVSLPPLTRAAVKNALRKFDELGRDRFLKDYGYGKASAYFLLEKGESYDAKAIVGAAYAFLAPRYKPLARRDFGSREETTKQWLERLGFKVVDRREIKAMRARRASERLDIGNLYSRAQLRRIFGTNDATIMTGVFRPPGTDSIFLFVTEHKSADRTQFVDLLSGDTLHWQGQLSGRTDSLIAEHTRRGLELLVFYRRDRYEYPQAAFRYEGIFRFQSKRGSHPTSFVLVRESPTDLMELAEEAADSGQAFDPEGVGDDRKKVATLIARRRGGREFRASLLSAYGRRCAMTGCNFAESLEAAHIYPYKGDRTNHVTNGLLLRADVHTLFDLGWIAIDPMSLRIVIHPVLESTTYAKLAGRRLALPRRASQAPSKPALRWHLDQSRIAKLNRGAD